MTRIIISIIFFSLLLLLTSCMDAIPKKPIQNLNYNNLIIYSDLSNRLDKQPNDALVIDQIIAFFVNECVKPGIKVNDRSSISFSRINPYNSQCNPKTIDIGNIRSLQEKQIYVNDKNPDHNLTSSIKSFKKEIACSYGEKDSGGLDILSLLYNQFNEGRNIKRTDSIFTRTDTTILRHENHVFIFTDGYLEFNRKKGNMDFYFGNPEINQIRRIVETKGVSVREAFEDRPDLKLKPLKTPNNNIIRLYVLETDDRQLDENTGTIKYTGEISDNNILKTAWEIWAEESGFKSFVWKQTTKGSTLAEDYIKKLIIID